ncbi:hypothetical protein ANASTE_00976 [Anaerofustis stercorihominis DSM 17244]|uniref:Uncharacterized protein n=1 Tax=Anaerofustis stercorihominis DSM 17244 TaxID=445971 RepID=B1C8B9_9FIRM|nr:hypothetical protein ANASTE_00976 [Anaerofustis stercorihominis DSM 17244]
MNDISKLKISFAEGFSTTQWKNFSRSFFLRKKLRGVFKGRNPFYVSFLTKRKQKLFIEEAKSSKYN